MKSAKLPNHMITFWCVCVCLCVKNTHIEVEKLWKDICKLLDSGYLRGRVVGAF